MTNPAPSPSQSAMENVCLQDLLVHRRAARRSLEAKLHKQEQWGSFLASERRLARMQSQLATANAQRPHLMQRLHLGGRVAVMGARKVVLTTLAKVGLAAVATEVALGA